MTFKGMLRILITEYRKQHDQNMFTVVQELMKTRRELREVKEQLQSALKLNDAASSSDNCNTPTPTINLFVQYNGFFNKLCAIPQTMTIEDLLVKLRQLTGISNDRCIHLRILSEDGLTTICFLHKENNRTLESYNDRLKDRMILSIEDTDDNKYQRKRLQRSKSTTSSEYNYSFDQTDV